MEETGQVYGIRILIKGTEIPIFQKLGSVCHHTLEYMNKGALI
jgi:hypothetical protein